MTTLFEDIKKQSEWTKAAFAEDGFQLDFSIQSTIEIDRFFEKNMINGKAKRGGRLRKNIGSIIFSIASYVAETILRNVEGSELITDDNDPYGEVNFSIKLPDGGILLPCERILKRLKNGFEDSVYPYVHQITKPFVDSTFDEAFWNIKKEVNEQKKPWWKI